VSGDDKLFVGDSTISGAGQGLFLRCKGEGGAVKGEELLREAARPIKRAEARRILSEPDWIDRNPVIQVNKDGFLDIRALLLYKSNHAKSSDWGCNTQVQRCGPSELCLVAIRDIREGEELMWEYSATWEPPGCEGGGGGAI